MLSKRQYIEDMKLYNKVRDQKVQWQMKLWFMAKVGEGVTGATWSSQDLTGKVSKICRYVRRGLGEDGFKGDKHDLTMSHRRGYVQRDG